MSLSSSHHDCPRRRLFAALPERLQERLQRYGNTTTSDNETDEPGVSLPGFAFGVRVDQGGTDVLDAKDNPGLYRWIDEDVFRAFASDHDAPSDPFRLTRIPSPPQANFYLERDMVTAADNSHMVTSFTNETHFVYKLINESVYFSTNPTGARDQIDYTQRPVLISYTTSGVEFPIDTSVIHEELTYWVLSGFPITLGALRAIAKNILGHCGYRLQCHGCDAILNSHDVLTEHVNAHAS